MEKKITKQTKLHIKKGDNVMVIAGNAKGKTGIIKEVLIDKSRAIVEGANLLTKHVKPQLAILKEESKNAKVLYTFQI